MTICYRCNSNPCGCNVSGCANPTPYYADTPCCVENNCQKIYVNQTSLGLKIQSAWNVPQCGGSAVLSVPGVVSIPVGEYLHHPTYGYFLVISFDAVLEQVAIENTCLTGNATPGTEVPRCSNFIPTPAPCCSNVGQTGVFLAVDFTAPADGNCLDITVTEETGLIAGNDVEIGTGVYLLSAIKANNIITICNTGDGIIAGTPVIAKNIAGEFQYPIQLITVNACSQTPVSSGKIVVCNTLSTSTLSGAVDGYLLTLINHTTGEAQYSGAEIAARQAETANRIAADIVLQNQLNAMLSVDATVSAASAAHLVNGAFTSFVSNVATIAVNNSSPTKAMAVIFNCVMSSVGVMSVDPTERMDLNFTLEVDILGAGYVPVVSISNNYNPRTNANYPLGEQFCWSFTGTIAATTTGTTRARATVTWLPASVGAANYNVTALDVTLSVLGTSV